jgi:hypothetical protein
MTTDLEVWRRVHEVFDPIVPAPPELRVLRTRYNPLSEVIGPRLRLPLPHQKYVLAGGIGSGKSTELQATAATLANSKLVVLVDLWKHFEQTVVDPGALDHLQPAELVGILGLAIVRTGLEVLGHDWRGLDKALGKAIGAVQTAASGAQDGPTVDVVKLGKGIAVLVGGGLAGLTTGPLGALAVGGAVDGGLKLLEAVSDASSWSWPVGLRDRKRSSDQDAPVRAVLQATNLLLDDIRKNYKRDVVLLVDGLDRVADAATFADLFVESGLLGDLRCDLVATLQLGLVQRYRSHLRWCRAYDFTYVPVALATDPTQPNPEGMKFFAELAAQRFATIGLTPIPPDLIERLAYRSGGRLREFITLVREVAVQAMLHDATQANDAHVDKAIDELRRDRESGLNTAHVDVLRRVLGDPEHQLPEGEVALDLLDRQLLLAYPNQSTWYLPHTILMLHLLRPIGGAASA